MDKKTVAEFFDRCAPWWDEDMVRNEPVICAILNNGGITAGVTVLDVACGTGVLFPDYLNRNVASVTGIDLSPKMAKIAQEKFPQVQVLCGDVEETDFGKKFDRIMVYNAFPHFPDPERLIQVLSGLLKPGGVLSVAHGMSRHALTEHHKRAEAVSIELLHEEDLARIFSKYLSVTTVISDDRMYQVCGQKQQ
jgi:demethylmenaquinone methyltransferase/2-methoxy-6-polyprenyl-1,4-benzoquinol methylase